MALTYRVDYRDQDDNLVIDVYQSNRAALQRARKVSAKNTSFVWVIGRMDGINKFQHTYYNGYRVDSDYDY